MVEGLCPSLISKMEHLGVKAAVVTCIYERIFLDLTRRSSFPPPFLALFTSNFYRVGSAFYHIIMSIFPFCFLI